MTYPKDMLVVELVELPITLVVLVRRKLPFTTSAYDNLVLLGDVIMKSAFRSSGDILLAKEDI